VYEPRILLMDEPLGALDKKLREDLQDELRQLHRRLGITIVYVTHDQEEAMRLSQRIAIFSHGKIVGLGTAMTCTRTRRTRLSRRSWATPTSCGSRPAAMGLGPSRAAVGHSPDAGAGCGAGCADHGAAGKGPGPDG
jgi:energy-coupling factor transporter ATP-binding protein EcfA2